MKTLTIFSLGFTTIVLMLLIIARSVEDPLRRKCRAIGQQLSSMEQDEWKALDLEECHLMLEQAENRLHKSELLKARLLAARHHLSSRERDIELSRLETRRRELRGEVDDMLDEIWFVIQVRHQRYGP